MMPHVSAVSRALAPATLCLLAACVPEPRSVETPPPAPTVQAPPPTPPALDWIDRPASPGTWTYRADAAGSTAFFGVPGRPGLSLRCDRAGATVTLTRLGVAPAPAAMVLRATDGARTIQATPAADGVAVRFAARDPLLDRLAFSRGRIMVEVAGAAALIAPSWAEIGRVVEDCRG